MRPERLALLSLLLLPAAAAALPSDRQQPIHIQAERVTIDEQRKLSTYEGDVELTQGSLQVQASRIVVHRGAEDERMVATGSPVRFRTQPTKDAALIRGEARTLEYSAGTAQVELSGNAHLWQGNDEFSGATIIYEADRNRVRASGGSDDGRVRAIIHPRGERP